MRGAAVPQFSASAPVKLAKLLYLFAGAALFVALLATLDLQAALALVWQAGPLGIAALCLVFFALFALDALVWLVLVPELPRTFAWYRRLIRVRLVGEAFNLVVPAGGFGGEPLKAVLLKSHYGVGYRESSAGLVLARIQGLIGQFLFVALAVIVMAAATTLPPLYQASAWIALVVLAGMTAGFVVAPKLRLSAKLGRRFGGRSWAQGLVQSLAAVEAVEDKINAFARAYRGRYALSLALTTLRWSLGAAEMWLAMHLLGHPLSVAEAIVLEGLLQLARSVSFFIPANLGTQDGAVALAAAAMTGVAAAGLGAALLRRVREVIFIALGFAVGGWYSWRTLRRAAADPAAGAEIVDTQGSEQGRGEPGRSE
jgi:glycosyltransferase 2 family protein